MKMIKVNAKCSDMFYASLVENGKFIGEYDGYVPDFMPGKHYGDYVTLDIDIETGKILNWTKPDQSQLDECFKPKEDKGAAIKGKNDGSW